MIVGGEKYYNEHADWDAIIESHCFNHILNELEVFFGIVQECFMFVLHSD